MDIRENQGKIVASVMVKMQSTLVEGITQMTDKQKGEIEQFLSKEWTEHAEELMQRIQKANCDFLGIGRELNAYHHNLWTKLDWEKEYPQIKIEPHVQVEIVNTGILN